MRGSRAAHCGLLCLAAAVVAAGCSHVDHRWRLASYSPVGAGAVKRVQVVGVADASWAPGLAAALTDTASDFVKLRRNYIVVAGLKDSGEAEASGDDLDDGPPDALALGAGAASCGAGIEGAVVLRALEATGQRETVAMTLSAELWACRGRRLLWQATGHHRMRADDPRLSALTASYRAGLGEDAAAWAALAFVLGQELLGDLPDPTLTAAEVEEKIEAG